MKASLNPFWWMLCAAALYSSTALHGQSPGTDYELVPEGTWPGFLRGYARGVAVHGRFAYVAAANGGLHVLDISNPAKVSRTGGYKTRGVAEGVAVSENVAYVAELGGELEVIDISDPANPRRLAGSPTSSGAVTVAVAGDYAYVGGNGLEVLDVSNPANPRSVGSNTAIRPASIALSGRYAFVAAFQQGLEILDVGDPATPKRIGGYAPSDTARGVAVFGSYAYLVCENTGLHVIDVSNPAQPKRVGGYDTQGTGFSVAVAGDVAYVADGGSGLEVIDVSQPASPRWLGGYRAEQSYAYHVAVSGTTVFVADTQAGLTIIDASSPSGPKQVGGFNTSGSARRVVVSGKHAYLADRWQGLHLLDLSNPTTPRKVGFFPHAFPEAVAVMGDKAYLASFGLQILNLEDPSNPRLEGQYITPGNNQAKAVATSGKYAYFAETFENAGWTTRLNIIDISNGDSPVRVGQFEMPGYAEAVANSANRVYLATGQGPDGSQRERAGTLTVIDVSDPANPRALGNYSSTGAVLSVSVVGQLACITVFGGGLELIDVSNPAATRRIGNYVTSRSAWQVTASGTRAYVADGLGVHVVDVSDPAKPRRLAIFGSQENSFGVAAVGDRVFVADGGAGLQVLDLREADSVVEFAGSANAVEESSGVVMITVTRAISVGHAFTVDYRTKDGTAKAGEDYSSVMGTLRFAAGETNKTITVPILNEGVGEADEQFEVVLSHLAPGAFLGSGATLAVTIRNDDPIIPPYATTHAAAVVAKTNAVLSGMATPNGFATLAWFQWGTTAEYGRTTSPIAVGSGTGVVHVKAQIESLIAKQTYHCRLVVSNAAGIALGHEVLFTTGAKVAAWGTFVGLPGDTLYPIKVPPSLDSVVSVAAAVERGESLALFNDGTLSKPFGGSPEILGPNEVIGAIEDAVAVSLGAAHAEVLRIDGTIAQLGSNLHFLGNSALSRGPSNIVAVTSGIFHALALRSDGTIFAWGDGRFGQTQVPPTLSNVVAIAAGNIHSIALRNDGTVVGWGNEGDSGLPSLANVPPGLSNAVAIAAGTYHNIALRADGTVVTWGRLQEAHSGVQGLSNVVAVAGGSSYSLALKKDGTVVGWGVMFDVGAGRFGLKVPETLSNVMAIAAGGTHVLALGPNSPPMAASQSPVGPAKDDLTLTLSGSDLNGDLLKFQIRSLPLTGKLYQFDNGGRGTIISAPNTMVTDPSGRVILSPDGQENIEARFTFTANDGEADSEPAEVTATIGNPSFLSFLAGKVSVRETDGFASLTVIRIGTVRGAAAVEYSTTGGTATSGVDYQLTTGTLTFAAGQANATFTVPILDDKLEEVDETVQLTLTNPRGSTLGLASTASLVISDDDGRSDVQFESSEYFTEEKTGDFYLYVTRKGNLRHAVNVDFVSSVGSATTSSDFVGLSGTITFAENQVRQAIRIPILDDTHREPAESFTVKLVNPSSGAVIQGSDTAIVNIADDDVLAANPFTMIGSWPGFGRGEGEAVAISGNRAYVAASQGGLHVYDISDPSAPMQVGHLEVGGHAQDVAMAGDYVCLAVGNAGGIFIIDVRDPANPRVAGALKGSATTVAVSGKFAYADFSSSQSGFHVIDISNPTQPKVVGVAERTDSAWSMAVAGNRVFAGCWQSLQVFDVTDPAHPRRVEALNVGYLARKVEVQSNKLFVSAEKELTIFDLSDAEKLVRLGRYSFSSGATVGMAIRGDHAFLSRSGVGFVAMNIADPARLSEVSVLNTMPGPVAISSGHAFLAVRGLEAVDIDSPATLRPVGHFDASGSAYAVAVSGNRAYLAEAHLWDFAAQKFRNRLQVLDVSDPSSPTRIGGVDLVAEPNHVVVAGNHAYVTEPLSVIDLSISEQPTRTATYKPDDGIVENLIVVGTIGYYSLKDIGLAILDLTIPENPRRLGTFSLPGIYKHGIASGNKLFLAGWWTEGAARKRGLRVLDISISTAPQLIGSYLTDGSPQEVVLSGHFAFLATIGDMLDLGPTPGAPGPGPMMEISGGLDIIDISNLAQPTRVSRIYEPDTGPLGGFWSVAVFGNRVYAASANHGLTAYDLSNPASPRLLEVYGPTTSSRRIVRAGNQLHVVAHNGLLIFGAPHWFFEQESYTVDEAAGEARVNVMRNAFGEAASKVRYRTREGSAREGTDFVAAEGTLTFAPNAGAAAITIPILNDALRGEQVAFYLDLIDRDGNAFAMATVNVRNNDTGFEFAQAGAKFDEGAGSVTVTVRRGTDLASPVSVDYSIRNGSAVAGQDYLGASGTLTFGPNESEKLIPISIIDDAIREGTESFTVVLSNPGAGTSLGDLTTVVVTINDDEPVLRFATSLIVARENEAFVQLVVHREGSVNSAVTVRYTTRDGSARAGLDYTEQTGSITFAPGETSKTLGVLLLDDQEVERNQSFQVMLLNPDGSAFPGSTVATIEIQDDEPVLRFSTERIEMGEDAPFVRLEVIREGSTTATATVNYSTRDGTAKKGTDYAESVGKLTFGPGVVQASAIIPLLDDLEPEDSETFEVSLSSPTGGAALTSPSTTLVIISDDEPVLRFTTAQVSIGEGEGLVQLTVARNGSTNAPVSFTYATRDGSAREGQDYVRQSATISLNRGERVKTIIIPLLDDLEPELAETFEVVLSAPTGGARLGSLTVATVVLQDNEPAKDVFEFESATYYAGEFDGHANITLARSPPARGSARVNFATGAASAISGTDFHPASGTAFFGEGQTRSTFSVQILEDSLAEGDEAIVLTLSNPLSDSGNEAVLGPRSTALLTIRNGGNAVEFANNAFTVSEKETFAHIVVRRRGDTNLPFSVDFATSEISAKSGKDFLAQAGTLTFAAGQPTNGFTVPILDNGFVDGSRSFQVSLTNVTRGVTLLSRRLAEFVIMDNEVPPIFDSSFEPGVNGPVHAALFQSDGKLIVAGQFDQVNGDQRRHLARLREDGSLDTSFASVFPTEGDDCCPDIRALLLQDDGRIVFGGYGSPRTALGRLNADGSLDQGFKPPPEIANGVLALAQADGKLLAGGEPFLYRLNRDGTRDFGFQTQVGFDGAVTLISPQTDGKLLVGGLFSAYNGVERMRVARLNADGSLDTSYNPPSVDPKTGNLYERALAIQADGRVILFGPGECGVALARLKADGSLDTGFRFDSACQPRAWWYDWIETAAVQSDGKVLVSGSVSSDSGEISGLRLSRFNSDGSWDESFALIPIHHGGRGPTVWTLLDAKGGRILIAGKFPGIAGRSQPHLALLRGDSLQAKVVEFEHRALVAGESEGISSITVRRLGDVTALASVHYKVSPGTAEAGTDFVAASGTLAFAPLETEKSFAVSLVDNAMPDPRRTVVLTLSNPTGDTLLGRASATLTLLDDDRLGSVDFRFNAGLALPPDSGNVFVERILPLPDGKVRLWGNFTTARGMERQGFAQLNEEGALDAGVTQSPPRFPVQPDGKYFGYLNNRFVRFNPDGSEDATFSVDYNPTTHQIWFPPVLQTDGKLLVRGSFTALGGIGRPGLARLHPDGSPDVGFDPGKGVQLADGRIGNITVITLQADGRILLGGDFASVGGLRRGALARLNTDGSLDTTFDPSSGKPASFTGNVWAMAVQSDGRILALGVLPAFNPAGTVGIVRLNANGSLDTVLDLGSGPRIEYPNGSTSEGSLGTIALDTSGDLLLGGEFTSFDSAPRSGIVRLKLEAPQMDRPTIARASIAADGAFSMTLQGRPGWTYRIETSIDLVNWALLREIPSLGAVTQFRDSGTANLRSKFYRAVRVGP